MCHVGYSLRRGSFVDTTECSWYSDKRIFIKPQCILPVDTPHEFVFVPEVGPLVADLLVRPEAFGLAYNFAGVDVITLKGVTEQVFAEVGADKPIFRAIQGLPLRFLGLFSPILREMIEMEYLLKTPVLLDDCKLLKVLPNLKKTSYEDGIRCTLTRIKKRI